jgi:hypothetical protein
MIGNALGSMDFENLFGGKPGLNDLPDAGKEEPNSYSPEGPMMKYIESPPHRSQTNAPIA